MAFTIALALVSGLFAQVIARHLRIPGIVLLLATGALLGPDVLNVIDPNTMGSVLQVIVGFAVAVILFEGGMNLNVKRLLQESSAIQRLITVGSLITAIGGTLAAKLLMDWSWPLSIMFGTLVIVTGPTVITPLLRRIKV
ncbi:MAG: cation:proton antiporter, partial [Candidatus Zixiibacteriota bacterium]